jgi:PIN domain nuclease of toxin-antitoxin system
VNPPSAKVLPAVGESCSECRSTVGATPSRKRRASSSFRCKRAHVSEARALPALRDPFDRLIVGTALALHP